MSYRIEKMQPSDWDEVKKIYLQGISTQMATFQTEAPSWESWNSGHISSCRLVACSEDGILGWAALSPTSSRPCYRGVAEVSIYIAEGARGQGVGAALLKKLVELSEVNDFWTLQSGIIRENAASISIHKKCGFREIGIRERVAQMSNGKWHDTVLLERRSKVTGQ